MSIYISKKEELSSFSETLAEKLHRDPRLAIDTEFIRERTYEPVLEIVQLATADGTIALLDMPALGGELGPLAPVLRDPNILKIVHAGGQDVEILAALLDGALPAPLFDTQIAGAFLGLGMQCGYGALVQSVLKVAISKEESFADWSRRPLTPAMRDYAANDVRYLHEIHDRLAARLEQRGRTQWASELTQQLLGNAATPTPPENLWLKVGGKQALDGRALAVLRELALWRDEEAKRRDKPRRTVMKDEPLVELAKRQPQTANALLELRGVPPNLGERLAAQLVERIKRGQAVPPSERPRLELGPSLDEHGAALLELFSAIVRVRATEEDLPPSLLAPSDELRGLAVGRQRPDLTGPLFSGWRGPLIGSDLAAALAGTLSVAWDPKRDRLIVQRG